MRAALLALVILLSGCGAPAAFDGQFAYDQVATIVHDGEALRDRVPGSPGHEATAQFLAQLASRDGWQVEIETFRGSEYLDLPAAYVESYRQPGRCGEDDRRRVAELRFHNIIATYETPSEHQVLLAAHWDAKRHATADATHPDAPMPGANDGASGVGLLLAYIAQSEARPPPVDVKVVFFDGEDGFDDCHPLAGSVFHAAALDRMPDRLLLLDMVGDPQARFIKEGTSAASDPDGVAWLFANAARFGLEENFVQRSPSIVDDHLPFHARGIPVVDLIDAGRPQGFPPYWHTTADTMDNLDADMLGRVGGLVTAYVAWSGTDQA